MSMDYEWVENKELAYTRKSTGYFVRPESSMRGGRNSTAFSSVQKRDKRKKNDGLHVLLTCGSEEPANWLKISLTIAITFYSGILDYWGLKLAPGDVQGSIVVDDMAKS